MSIYIMPSAVLIRILVFQDVDHMIKEVFKFKLDELFQSENIQRCTPAQLATTAVSPIAHGIS